MHVLSWFLHWWPTFVLWGFVMHLEMTSIHYLLFRISPFFFPISYKCLYLFRTKSLVKLSSRQWAGLSIKLWWLLNWLRWDNFDLHLWLHVHALQVCTSISIYVFLLTNAFCFQRRIVGLHQNTSIGSTDITDVWEPLEEGLLPYDTIYSSLILSVHMWNSFHLILAWMLVFSAAV